MRTHFVTRFFNLRKFRKSIDKVKSIVYNGFRICEDVANLDLQEVGKSHILDHMRKTNLVQGDGISK